MIFHARQRECIADWAHKRHCLSGRTPVHIWRQGNRLATRASVDQASASVQKVTWLLDCDVDVEQDFYAVCEQGSPPVNNKHDNAAEQSAEQRQPHVVVFICWSPA